MKFKTDFQDGGLVAVHDTGNNFWSEWSKSFLIYRLLGYLISSFESINWPFGSGGVQNRFSRWQLWWPSWIFNQNNLTSFDQQVTLILPSFECLSVQEKKLKTDFQDGSCGRHFGFLIRTISDQNHFWPTGCPDTSYHISSQFAFPLRRS